MTSNFIPSSVIYMEKLDSMRFWCKLENFAKSAQIWSQHVRLVLTKKTSTYTLCFWPWTTKLLGVESGQIMPHVRHCCRTSPDVNEPYAHRRCASDERLIFYNITRCYGKRVTVFAVAIAAGDIIKYQPFVYGSFVWRIHVRYNNIEISTGYNPRTWIIIIWRRQEIIPIWQKKCCLGSKANCCINTNHQTVVSHEINLNIVGIYNLYTDEW